MKWSFQRFAWGSYDGDRLARQVQWAPDGTCVLCSGEGGLLSLFEVGRGEKLDAVVKVREADSVRDVAWYPWMTSADPVSCVFASCCRDNPAHLWDGYTGELRATYRSFNAMDEITAPYSLSFDPTGTKLYCGFDKILRIFDVSRPGRDYVEVTTAGKRQAGGQSGILSVMDWARDGSGILAVGSFSGTVAFYDARSAPRKGPQSIVHCNKSGITDLKIAADSVTVAAGGRRDRNIHGLYMHLPPLPHPTLCSPLFQMTQKLLTQYFSFFCILSLTVWDLRNTERRLFDLKRNATSSQRIGLDVAGDFLFTGGRDGIVQVFNLTTGETTTSSDCGYGECISDVSINPSISMMATIHGERKYSPKSREPTAAQTQPSAKAGIPTHSHKDSRTGVFPLMLWTLHAESSPSTPPAHSTP